MTATFPYQSPVVATEQELLVTRHLPGTADLRVRTGARVKPEQAIAQIDKHHVAERIALSSRLELDPGEITRHLERPVGSQVMKGDVLAKARHGLRSLTELAPFPGTIAGVDAVTGELLLAPEGADEPRALVHGEVVKADAASGVVIHTFGSRVLGIAGLGTAVNGPLVILQKKQNGEGWEIDGAAVQGAIVVVPDPLTAGVIRQLMEAGAKGIVIGGLSVSTLATAFYRSAADALSAWRSPLVATRSSFPLPLMFTEGFGDLPMNSNIAGALQKMTGEPAALLPETSVRPPLRRPELIISDPTRLDEDGPAALPVMTTGAQVRFAEPSRAGRAAVVRGTPYQKSQCLGPPVMTADLDTGGDTEAVPVRCLEVVQ